MIPLPLKWSLFLMIFRLAFAMNNSYPVRLSSGGLSNLGARSAPIFGDFPERSEG